WGGCNITKINGPYTIFTAGTTDYYDASYTPPGSNQLVSTITESVDVLITGLGVSCPPSGSPIDITSAAPWQSLATGGGGAGAVAYLNGVPSSTDGCGAGAGKNCSWQMSLDWSRLPPVVEVPEHYCRFTRNTYQWAPTSTRCDYQTQYWN